MRQKTSSVARVLLTPLAILIMGASSAQTSLPAEQLPEIVRSQWTAFAKKRGLEVSTRLNPFVWRGDFDGDGRQDFALFVRGIATNKEGVAIVLAGASAIEVIGAGVPFGNGGDDFSWMDFWAVEEPVPSAASGRADRLVIAKSESASAVIFLKNGKPVWQQAGD